MCQLGSDVNPLNGHAGTTWQKAHETPRSQPRRLKNKLKRTGRFACSGPWIPSGRKRPWYPKAEGMQNLPAACEAGRLIVRRYFGPGPTTEQRYTSFVTSRVICPAAAAARTSASEVNW